MIPALPAGGLDIAGNRAECGDFGGGFGSWGCTGGGFGEPYAGKDGNGDGVGTFDYLYCGAGLGGRGAADGESNRAEAPLCLL